MVASLPGTKEPFMRREATSRSGRRPDKASLLLIFVVNWWDTNDLDLTYSLSINVIYLEVESVDRAEMSPKRKFAFVGFCPRLSTFPWLGLDSPRVATSFGSYGLKRRKSSKSRWRRRSEDSRVWEEVVHLGEVASRQRRWRRVVLVNWVHLGNKFFYFIWQEGENNLTSRLSLSSSPLPLRFTLLFFLLACFTILGVFTSPFTSFGKIP